VNKFGWLKQTGHSFEEPSPSLFTFNLPRHPLNELMGISVENARVKIRDTQLAEEGPLLITHWGLSGPVILRLSAWGSRELKSRQWNFEISIQWNAGRKETELREYFSMNRNKFPSVKVFNRNDIGLPQRLWEYLGREAGANETTRWSDLPASVQNKMIALLTAYPCSIHGKTTFKEEFVTAGGIKLSEIDPHSMISKKNQRLFFAGEIMDVDGITGGYNFQHAWTSGWIAANSIAQDLSS
jgi:predicted Rossmann fold flavoprotein